MTGWVSDGTTVTSDTPVAPRPVVAADHEHLAFVREVFLPLARHRGVAPVEALDSLEDYAWTLDAAPALAVSAASRSVAAPMPASKPAPLGGMPPGWGQRPPGMGAPAPASPAPRAVVPAPAVAPAPRPAPVAVKPPEPREPGRVSVWWSHTASGIGADLAAHGLAYLGVLLLFVGAFGLVAFSFGDVAEGMRPVAEVGIAATPFLAAWILLRRGAEIAGRALEVAGGLLLPVMLITSFLDGVPATPDLTGVPLVIATTVVASLVSAAYWLWTRRHPASGLRFLVAPVAWLAVGLATMGVGRDIPSGAGVATISAVQTTCMVLAVIPSLLWARVTPDGPVSRGTLTASRVGVVVLAPLALMTWAVGGWPTLPVLVTGLAGLAVLELLELRAARVIQPLWWALTCLALLPGLDAGLQVALLGALAAVGFLVLLEISGREVRRAPMALSAVGLTFFTLVTWADLWVAVGAMAALAVWTGVRRLRPWAGWTVALDVAAGVLPVAAVAALGGATRHAPMGILVASGLVLASLAVIDVPKVRAALSRGASDHFWMLWWDAGMVATTVAVAVMTAGYWPSVVAARWMLVAVPVVLAVSAWLGPLGRAGRVWATTGLLTWAWLMAAGIAGWPAGAVSVALAAAGLVLVLAASSASGVVARWASPGATALVGHVLTLTALLAAVALDGSSWLGTALVAVLTLALGASVAADERSRSPILLAVDGDLRVVLRHALHVLLALCLVVTAVLVVGNSDLVDMAVWGGATVSVVALAIAGATRLPLSRALRWSASWSSVVLSVLALGFLSGFEPMLAGLGVIAVMPLALAPRDRVRPSVWMSWSSLAPILGILATQALSAYAGLEQVLAAAIAMVVMGGALLLTSLALDLRGRAWRLHVVPTGRGLAVPAAVGAVEVTAAVVLGLSVPWGSGVAGWVTLAAAGVVLAVAVLQRLWSLLGAAAGLVWLGVWQLAGDALASMPWVGLLAAVSLLGAAEASRRLPIEGRAWARGDLPLLAVAHLTALTSLLTMGTGTSAALVLLAVAALSLVLAVRLRALVGVAATYGVAGACLLIAAGAMAGYGWLALALAAVSVGCSAVATRTTGALRVGLVLLGGLLAFTAWMSFATWLDLSAYDRAAWTGMLAGGVAVLSAALLRWTSLARPVLLTRGVLAMAVLTVAPALGGMADDGSLLILSVWSGVALALGALAAGLSAHVLHPALRYLSLLYAVAASFELFAVLGVTTLAEALVFEAVVVFVIAALLLRPLRSRLGEWLTPLTVLGWAASVLAVFVATAELPDTQLISSALVLAGLYAMTYGVVLRSLTAQLLAPWLVCAAWIAWALQALSPDPQWYTVPLGLTTIVVSDLVRKWGRDKGAAPYRDLAVVDLVGVLLLVCASFVQALTVSIGYAVLGLLLGALVVGWGVLTRVRRRLVMGGVVVVLSAVVLVLVPLAQLLPGWSNAVMWTLVACVGLLALLGATLVERGRAVVRRGVDELARLTEGWE